MKSKNLLMTMLLMIVTSMVFCSCTKDEEFDNSVILGSWISNTSSISTTWTFNKNNTATERVIIKLGGYTIDDRTLTFTYDYKGSTIELITETGKVLNYEISVNGNKMRLGNSTDGYFDLTKK